MTYRFVSSPLSFALARSTAFSRLSPGLLAWGTGSHPFWSFTPLEASNRAVVRAHIPYDDRSGRWYQCGRHISSSDIIGAPTPSLLRQLPVGMCPKHTRVGSLVANTPPLDLVTPRKAAPVWVIIHGCRNMRSRVWGSGIDGRQVERRRWALRFQLGDLALPLGSVLEPLLSRSLCQIDDPPGSLAPYLWRLEGVVTVDAAVPQLPERP